jgi:hypothetical protein
MTPCFIFMQDPLNSGGAGASANADVSEKIGEFLGIGNWRKARAARADKRLRFFGMKLRQGFTQGAGQSFKIRLWSDAQHSFAETIKKRGGALEL